MEQSQFSAAEFKTILAYGRKIEVANIRAARQVKARTLRMLTPAYERLIASIEACCGAFDELHLDLDLAKSDGVAQAYALVMQVVSGGPLVRDAILQGHYVQACSLLRQEGELAVQAHNLLEGRFDITPDGDIRLREGEKGGRSGVPRWWLGKERIETYGHLSSVAHPRSMKAILHMGSAPIDGPNVPDGARLLSADPHFDSASAAALMASHLDDMGWTAHAMIAIAERVSESVIARRIESIMVAPLSSVRFE